MAVRIRELCGALTELVHSRAFRRVALRDRCSEEQRGGGNQRHEDLEQEEALVGAPRRKRTETVHRPPDGHARRHERHTGRPVLPEAECAPDHEGEDPVEERVAAGPRPGARGEDDQARDDEGDEQDGGLGDTPGVRANRRRADPDEHEGRHHEGPHRVADPPDRPEHPEHRPGLDASGTEAEHARRGAHDRAAECREDDESENVRQSSERGGERRTPEQPGPDHGLGGVAEGNGAGRPDRLARRRIGEEGSEQDARPAAGCQQEQREGDPGRWPDRRHLLGDRGHRQAELRRAEVHHRGREDRPGRADRLPPDLRRVGVVPRLQASPYRACRQGQQSRPQKENPFYAGPSFRDMRSAGTVPGERRIPTTVPILQGRCAADGPHSRCLRDALIGLDGATILHRSPSNSVPPMSQLAWFQAFRHRAGHTSRRRILPSRREASREKDVTATGKNLDDLVRSPGRDRRFVWHLAALSRFDGRSGRRSAGTMHAHPASNTNCEVLQWYTGLATMCAPRTYRDASFAKSRRRNVSTWGPAIRRFSS